MSIADFDAAAGGRSEIPIRELRSGERALCEPILRSLPEWFGVERSIREYVHALREIPAFGAWANGGLAGFLGLKLHGPGAAEIHVMAVRAEYHRRGIGRALVSAAEAWLRGRGVRWVQVKTLGPSCDYEPYARTRAFYASLGYEPLEEFPDLWDPGNPCLLSVKRL